VIGVALGVLDKMNPGLLAKMMVSRSRREPWRRPSSSSSALKRCRPVGRVPRRKMRDYPVAACCASQVMPSLGWAPSLRTQAPAAGCAAP
jgi:hypothetical protein